LAEIPRLHRDLPSHHQASHCFGFGEVIVLN
jgi:hypothetical protein